MGHWPECIDAPKPNLTKLGYDGSLRIVVTPVILVLLEFLLDSAQWHPKTADSESLLQKMEVLSPQKTLGGPIFIAVPLLLNNSTKTSVGEELVKIHPVAAEQLASKEIKTKKYRTRNLLNLRRHLCLAMSGAV